MENNLSHFFKRKEFACHCGCGKDTVDHELLTVLEEVRDHFNAPVKINSGNRCFNYNHQIGGSSSSQHLLSKAADIVVKGIDPQDVYDILNLWYPGNYGIGLYKLQGFLHFDVRSCKARW